MLQRALGIRIRERRRFVDEINLQRELQLGEGCGGVRYKTRGQDRGDRFRTFKTLNSSSELRERGKA